ncbi:hypothetical protein CFR79_08320 [Komagataeibacter saccharivorans]|uniref:hypothetical protein n=1 Tax=Komagataeibacter saccharivorans TaxID=265959 RepID=UPI000D7C1234|nr:hypothetical protein [Komagataeibacter saccharivorans]PYD50654.1 hypothetical protein CFR79_08320 [Komagataeibacter saccharivorans]
MIFVPRGHIRAATLFSFVLPMALAACHNRPGGEVCRRVPLPHDAAVADVDHGIHGSVTSGFGVGGGPGMMGGGMMPGGGMAGNGLFNRGMMDNGMAGEYGPPDGMDMHRGGPPEHERMVSRCPPPGPSRGHGPDHDGPGSATVDHHESVDVSKIRIGNSD